MAAAVILAAVSPLPSAAKVTAKPTIKHGTKKAEPATVSPDVLVLRAPATGPRSPRSR
jgi:hypothetical protein